MSIISDLTGRTAARASREAGALQAQAAEEGIVSVDAATERALGFLDPFAGVGQQGIDQAGFLTDPQQQFDFLQNNPLFQLALENANTQTSRTAAAGGRLSAGDTLQQLSKNVLLSASPLIQGQKQSIGDLLNLGSGVAANQAGTVVNQSGNIVDLITGGAAAQAAGGVGAANARGAGAQNILSSALLAGGIFSDIKLKENVVKILSVKGVNIYSWTWNRLAGMLGLKGNGFGVIAQEIQETIPEAIIKDGYLKVNYDLIGMPHG